MLMIRFVVVLLLLFVPRECRGIWRRRVVHIFRNSRRRSEDVVFSRNLAAC